MRFVGIDPGASGGIAVLDGHGDVVKVVQASDERELCDLLREATQPPCRVVLEKVSGYIGDPHPGSAMFVFGRNVGVTVGCLLTLGVAFEEVEPQRWQSALGLKRKNATPRDKWKRVLKAHAQSLWPDYRVTLWACDSLLLARFAMLQSGQVPAAVPPDDALNDPWVG